MASEEAIWSGSTLFFIQFVNLHVQTTGWQSEMAVAQLIYLAGTREMVLHYDTEKRFVINDV